jgi:transposase-like protein
MTFQRPRQRLGPFHAQADAVVFDRRDRGLRQAERDLGRRDGMTTSDRERLKDLERENRELKRGNEILRKASAYFAQAELDRRPK